MLIEHEYQITNEYADNITSDSQIEQDNLDKQILIMVELCKGLLRLNQNKSGGVHNDI